MKDLKKTEVKGDEKSGVNPVAAAVTGAVIGASVMAGAIAMSDKNNRDKVKEVISDAKDKVEEMKKSD